MKIKYGEMGILGVMSNVTLTPVRWLRPHSLKVECNEVKDPSSLILWHIEGD